jgi:hypothetical protein
MRTLAPLVAASVFLASPGYSQTVDPFTNLRGNWGGSGTMTLKDGEKERLVCDAQYTGSATQLRLVIGCKSSFNEIRMNASLSANSGRLLGTWEESTYKAIGTISGIATENNIKFYIGGNVLGTMNVQYTKTRQSVAIKTTGVSLQDVNLKLTRR